RVRSRSWSWSSQSRSVEARVHRTCGVPREFSRLTAQDRAYEILALLEERVMGFGRDDVPGTLVDLVLELARPPACIAGEDPQPREQRLDVLDRRLQVEHAQSTCDRAETLGRRGGVTQQRQSQGAVGAHGT